MPSHSPGARSGVALCAIPEIGGNTRQLVCGYRDNAVGDEAGIAVIYDLLTNVEPDFPDVFTLVAPPLPSTPNTPDFDFGIEEDILASTSIDAAERARETADLDHDDVVNHADMMMLLEQFGPCDANCKADFNQDGIVDTFDVLALLSVWED